jgi:hypothetical protein
MDLSKLPKLSQTPAPPANDAVPGQAAADGPAKVELFCRCGAPITPGTNFCSHCGANYYEATGAPAGPGFRQAGMWFEALISIAFGLFLLMVSPGGTKYLSAKFAGRPYTPYLHPSEPGQFVDYLRYQDTSTGAVRDYKYGEMFDAFWSDMVITAFALALILDGIVMALARNRRVIMSAAVLIAAVTLLNLWYVIASYTRTNPITGHAYGLPMISALAVIAGITMAGYQFQAAAQQRR